MARRLKPCGTEAAYYRHRRAGETPCDACVDGLAEARLNRGVTKRKRRPSRHGTNSMYVQGCRCDDCRSGHAAYMREYNAGRQRAVAENTRDVIIDQMLTDGRPMAAAVIIDKILDRHPDKSPAALSAALTRLGTEGYATAVAVDDEWRFEWSLTEAGRQWFDRHDLEVVAV